MQNKDENKKKELRKHKTIATGLFFLMALIYGLMVYLQHQNVQAWMGYVEAFSEAGMVGALADWFAVTALFRYPLGLKIPHTNIIERKKNALGDNLGTFVKENFLNPQNIRPYIENLNVAHIIGGWFDKPKNTKVLKEEIIKLIEKIVADLEDEEVEKFLQEKGMNLLNNIDYQKITAAGMQYALNNNEHIAVLEKLLPQIKNYIAEHEELILNQIEKSRPFIAFLAGKKISRELTSGIISFIEEIEGDKNHFVRNKLTETLFKFITDLEQQNKWEAKINALKNEFITAENLNPYAKDAWAALKKAIKENLDNPDSMVQNYLAKTIENIGTSLKTDHKLKTRINAWAQYFIYRMILKNRGEAEQLISKTVAGWEGKELSNKLELEVGKDLQFIRVNGTLVGGLVGLIIYTITQFFI